MVDISKGTPTMEAVQRVWSDIENYSSPSYPDSTQVCVYTRMDMYV